MLSSTDTIETTKRNSEVEFKEEIIEETEEENKSIREVIIDNTNFNKQKSYFGLIAGLISLIGIFIIIILIILIKR